MMQFKLQHTDSRTKARAGELQTDHGAIRTPIFMPVGTAAAVKGVFHRDVREEAQLALDMTAEADRTLFEFSV